MMGRKRLFSWKTESIVKRGYMQIQMLCLSFVWVKWKKLQMKKKINWGGCTKHIYMYKRSVRVLKKMCDMYNFVIFSITQACYPSTGLLHWWIRKKTNLIITFPDRIARSLCFQFYMMFIILCVPSFNNLLVAIAFDEANEATVNRFLFIC